MSYTFFLHDGNFIVPLTENDNPYVSTLFSNNQQLKTCKEVMFEVRVVEELVGLIFKCLQPLVLFRFCLSYSWFPFSCLFLQPPLRSFGCIPPDEFICPSKFRAVPSLALPNIEKSYK
jgi:hypothetical protein